MQRGNWGHVKMSVAAVLGDWSTYLIIFFLQDKDYIPGLDARCLVSLPSKGNFLAVLHAFVHVYLQNLHLLHNFLALTFFTAVFLTDDFTLSGLEKARWEICAGQEMLDHGLGHCALYLLHYNQYTQTASVGPFLGPAVWSWCACHAPYMLYIFGQRPSCLPACIQTHTHRDRFIVRNLENVAGFPKNKHYNSNNTKNNK